METQQSQTLMTPIEAGADAQVNSMPDAHQLRPAVEGFEKQFLLDVLAQNQGNKAQTAAMLGVDRKTLYTKLRKYGVS